MPHAALLSLRFHRCVALAPGCPRCVTRLADFHRSVTLGPAAPLPVALLPGASQHLPPDARQVTALCWLPASPVYASTPLQFHSTAWRHSKQASPRPGQRPSRQATVAPRTPLISHKTGARSLHGLKRQSQRWCYDPDADHRLRRYTRHGCNTTARSCATPQSQVHRRITPLSGAALGSKPGDRYGCVYTDGRRCSYPDGFLPTYGWHTLTSPEDVDLLWKSQALILDDSHTLYSEPWSVRTVHHSLTHTVGDAHFPH